MIDHCFNFFLESFILFNDKKSGHDVVARALKILIKFNKNNYRNDRCCDGGFTMPEIKISFYSAYY